MQLEMPRRRPLTRAVVAGIACLASALALVPATAHATLSTTCEPVPNVGELINAYSGKRADVMWASTAPYQPVFLWENNESSSQVFDVLKQYGSNCNFLLRARHSGQCVMPDPRQGPWNGTRVVQYPDCTRSWRRAQWTFSRVPGRYYDGVLVNTETGRCLDADNGRGGAPPIGAALQLWECIRSGTDWNAGNQLWVVRGYY